MFVWYVMWGFGGKAMLMPENNWIIVGGPPPPSMSYMMIPGTYAQMREDYD